MTTQTTNLSAEEIAEGRELLTALKSAESLGATTSAMYAQFAVAERLFPWLIDHAPALLDASERLGRMRQEVQGVVGLIDDEVLAALDFAMRECDDEDVANRLEFAVPWVRRAAAKLERALSDKES